MSGGLKTIKGGKTEDVPYVEKITLRGVEYTIRELSVVEYKECLKAATVEGSNFTPFGALLDAIVLRAVSPGPAAGGKPMSYPIYRRLEGIVNEMHFTDVESDEEIAAREGEAASGEEAPAEEAEAPNS